MATTLLNMAGAARPAPDWPTTALVMIDAQEEYRSHALTLPGVEAALNEGARLIAHLRAMGGQVIHIQHEGANGGPFDIPSGRGAIMPEVAPIADEPVIRKRLPNSFAGTDLEETLRGAGVQHLILAGFMTHMCVSATARAALDLGLGPVTIVAGACATRDLPNPLGHGIVPARDVHRATLAALSDRFAFIVADTAAL
ncbi:nicotinamidase-related amidase [Rubricella aquisinus]|uniref:Nicotinamidase-related amidase n=1 Tax=Rubricella aquisinus TaxID=2028108 RepID=A0A840WW56_9RHOB|nr:cysteine hydrolase family protein [Rubricella aquisinus]MBB5515420.1 nicotinamidase-related amidase [Rubricella aquisinus]